MPSSSIAQILLRIFALNWFLVGLIHFASVAFTFYKGHYTVSEFVPATFHLIAGILVWIVSPKLSVVLARRNDGEFELSGITEQNLYSAVILGLGLYFSLSSFAAAITWVHFFTLNSSPDHGFHQENHPSYYDMTETLLTLAAGVLLVVNCKTLAGKLARN